jgi:hypothetical protein
MTNRYVTATEKAGTLARQHDYRQRLVSKGLMRKEFNLTEFEAKQVRDLIQRLRQTNHAI